jgi:hypothetical protein
MADNKALVVSYIEKEHPSIFKILQTPTDLQTAAERMKLKIFKSMHSKEDLAKKAKKYFEDKAKKVIEAADRAAAKETDLGAALESALASRRSSRWSILPTKSQVGPGILSKSSSRFSLMPPSHRQSAFLDFSAFLPPGVAPTGGARKRVSSGRRKVSRKRKSPIKKRKSPLKKRRKVTKVSKKRSPKRKPKRTIKRWSW